MALISKAQKESGVVGDIVEIGVYKGKTFFFLSGLLASGERLIGVDQFTMRGKDLLPEVKAYAETACENRSQCTLLKCFTKALRDHPLPSANARIIHIDAGHEHDDVYFDLATVYRQCFPDHGGVIIMDDAMIQGFPGIQSAIYQFILTGPGNDLRPFLMTRGKMYLCRAKDHHHFKSVVAEMGEVSVRNVLDVSVLVRHHNIRKPEPEPIEILL
nr:class I SAM-dependent methyltransferase [Ruegeria sp. HKCCA5426]